VKIGESFTNIILLKQDLNKPTIVYEVKIQNLQLITKFILFTVE